MKRKIKRSTDFEVIIRQQREIQEMQKDLEIKMDVIYGQGELIHDLLTEIKAKIED